ncbi:hypothetical protein JRG66_03985 [Salinimicrobium tongyeongense]|uniref:Uncharacterized protein n=1 Tax=Salinimicrobium tongyeongense TaxID=2809707 RepID=A0ABY6NT04_9FLAO|nr:DUF6371 domain-containing protein [Salinimicrobium tongyeongense]UZH56039.1 hypothetical protein JRG66_03985 [Salinimicrobium tongyeongense]
MEQHRYTLEKGSKKDFCPACNKKRFVHYVDTETGEYLPNQYGRCDRESKCGYHLNPYKNGYSQMIKEQEQGTFNGNWKPDQYARVVTIKKPLKSKPAFIPVEVLKQTLEPDRYEQNVFIQNLFNNVPYPFEVSDVTKAVELYKIGTIKAGYRKGAVTFPFIDLKGNIRAVQVKQFNKSNHTTGTDFLHSIIDKHHSKRNEPLPNWLQAYNKNELKVSCLFGEHLLSKYPLNPVALVEAPKTAFYGTLYFGFPEQPEDLIWLAVYNKSSFKFDKLKVLKGRTVLTFPDLSKDGQTFKEWKQKATGIESRLPGTRFIFSDLLEQLAPEADKKEGNDIADYLIKQDWQNFRKRKPKQKPPEPVPEIKEPVTEVRKIRQPKKETEDFEFSETIKKEPEDWQTDISELERYFEKMRLPPEPVRLNQCTVITNVSQFLKSHLQTVKSHNGNNRFLPYLNRLQQLRTTLN